MKNLIAALSAVAALMIIAAPASADTTAAGDSSVTADVVPTLEATFPADYGWGDLNAGVAGNESTEQTVNVKSNATWGVKTSTDDAAGKLTEWDGGVYVAVTPKVLTHALTWKRSSLAGVPDLGTSYAAFSAVEALVIGSQAVTADAGVNVGAKYRQVVSYGDFVAGVNDYRILVNYSVQQGF
jgi:hypothetical protein